MRTSVLAAVLCALGPVAASSQTPVPEQARPTAGSARPSPDPEPGAEVEIRTLEERVGELKERIHRTKARLQGLQELAVGGDLSAGARAVVVHRNEMGASYVLEAAAFALDGAAVWARADAAGELDRRDELPVFEGRLAPGSHQLALRLTYRGKGEGAPRFQVESAYTFAAEPATVTHIRIVGYERSGARLEDRPAVRYDLDVKKEEPAPRPGRADPGGAAR